MSAHPEYRWVVRKHVDLTAVSERLATCPVVVLERIARGGGATRWYRCSEPKDLDTVIDLLSPGSVVSFYFDDRIEEAAALEDLQRRATEWITEAGEAVVARLGIGEVHLAADIVCGPNDLADFLTDVHPGDRFFVGAFPGRDNDGIGALTFTLPDPDGIVRPQPH